MTVADLLTARRGARVLDVQPDGTAVLVCDRCASTFPWTARAQAEYARQRLDSRPRRCPPCRQIVRRERRPQETPA